MRGSSSTWQPHGWLDPIAACEALVAPGSHVVLLESTEETGLSYLLLGDQISADLPRQPLDPAADRAPLWAGWISFEGDPRFLRVDRSITFHHASRRLEVTGDAEWRDAVQDALASRHTGDSVRDPGSPGGPSAAPAGPAVSWRHDDSEYLEMIAACQAAIRRGDAYQLCLTNTALVEPAPDPWQTYLRLRSSSRTHHAGYLSIGGVALVSASPERFVELAPDGTIRSSPIKGTRRRDTDPVADAALAAELVADEKERAENLMIVDLVRNDLSRISVLGSVRVTRLLEVESYAQVHQLVSTVEAVLLPELTASDAVGSLFPAGSMTGAPKSSALRILGDLEKGPRGIYSGAFGLVRADGSADLAMVIRSIVFEGGAASVGAGGGITALSRPQAEVDEMHLKAAPLLAALGAG